MTIGPAVAAQLECAMNAFQYAHLNLSDPVVNFAAQVRFLRALGRRL
jgi:hypothetical protein